MSEPIYLAQTGECKTREESDAWFRARIDEAREKGAVFYRYSSHPEIPNLLLIEGWDAYQADQGDPRWQLTVA